MRGETGCWDRSELAKYYISIHSPHAGRDVAGNVHVYKIGQFQSTLPMRGETHCNKVNELRIELFQSTLPMRGETMAMHGPY